MRYFIYITVFCSMALTACNKYLDVTPKGYTLLTTVENYDQWLNDANVLGTLPSQLNLLGDNVDKPNIPVPPISAEDLIYTWALQFTTNVNTNPTFWGDHYATINKYNTLLLGIDAATGGTSIRKRQLKAEALLGRAFEYFYLVNEYGKPYDPTTAAQDLGVPLVSTNDISAPVPARSTVKEVYDRIIADVAAAIPDLPASNKSNRYRGSIAAAYSVLARVYLYRGDYQAAIKNAELALQKGDGLAMINYNNVELLSAVNAAILSASPDAIYARGVEVFETPTVDFINSFNPNDLRLQWWYYGYPGSGERGKVYAYAAQPTSLGSKTNFGTSVQEMKLIIAEAAARNNNQSVALTQLNEVRINRIKATQYQPFQSTDQDVVLQRILLERTFEFGFSGLRWFDMRRLDKEGLLTVVNRYDAQGNIISTLAPRSPKYTMQIPIQVLRYTPSMPQNPQ